MGSMSSMQPDGPLREVLLDPGRLAERQAQADRLLEADGAGHLVHDLPVRADGRVASIESRPWRVDPIPIVLDGATFRWLSRAVSERMRALDAVIGDLYGERLLVRDRVVPAEALAATERYRINASAQRPCVGSAPTPSMSYWEPTACGTCSKISPTRRPASVTPCSTGP
jgi:uncharacterized circularly permuted ATP-grasp superfamily protein